MIEEVTRPSNDYMWAKDFWCDDTVYPKLKYSIRDKLRWLKFRLRWLFKYKKWLRCEKR